jgi:lysozyme
MFGGGLFNSFDDHPRKRIRRRSGTRYITSTAAGAYQFLARTWDDCAGNLDLPDFSPASQDRAARFLIYRRGAMTDVLAGRLEAAVKKCNREWASLPGSPYGQPTITMARCKQLFADAGGVSLER